MRRMRGKFTQLDGFAAAAVISFGFALPWAPVAVSSPAAVVLCFVLVGVIWAAVITPLTPNRSVVTILVAITSCALGWAIVGGLLLNFLPSGLNRTNWLVYAVIVCIAGYLIARFRGNQEVFSWRHIEFGAPTWRTVLKLGATAALLIAAVLVSVFSNIAKDREFTELWLVPNNPAGAQVKVLESNSPTRAIDATVGVKNQEGESRRYTLVFDSGANVTTTNFTLGPEEEMTKVVPIDGDEASAALYLGDQTQGDPYRKVWVARR
ncbi:hypothetical protein [Mycobacterium sp. JS623]|uniref:hypothetical protein n=1 Tax=Mycobacterium sp. JS623 TaxID=212767 RepID=UPI003FA53ABD